MESGVWESGRGVGVGVGSGSGPADDGDVVDANPLVAARGIRL